MTGSGCVCTVVMTDLALSLVFVSERLWETGSQASEWTENGHLTTPRALGLDNTELQLKFFDFTEQSFTTIFVLFCESVLLAFSEKKTLNTRQTKDFQVKIYNIFVV